MKKRLLNYFSKISAFQSPGFTLIELLVVIAISMIIGAVSLAAYNTYSRKQRVDQSTYNLQGVFDKARFNALSNVRPPQCPATHPSTKRHIVHLISPSSYELIAVCWDGSTENTQIYETHEFPSSVEFKSIGTGGCGGYFYYESISNTFYCGPPSGPVAIVSGTNTIRVGDDSSERTLTISQNGQVKVN